MVSLEFCHTSSMVVFVLLLFHQDLWLRPNKITPKFWLRKSNQAPRLRQINVWWRQTGGRSGRAGDGGWVEEVASVNVRADKLLCSLRLCIKMNLILDLCSLAIHMIKCLCRPNYTQCTLKFVFYHGSNSWHFDNSSKTSPELCGRVERSILWGYWSCFYPYFLLTPVTLTRLILWNLAKDLINPWRS